MTDNSGSIQALYGVYFFSEEVRAITQRPGLTMVQWFWVDHLLATTSTAQILKSRDGREVVGVTTEESAQLLTIAQIVGIQLSRPVLP